MKEYREMEPFEVLEGKSAAMPKVEELLQILIETNQQQAAQSVAFMMEFMDNMEGQLERVNKELEAVRKEIGSLQDTPETKPARTRLSRIRGVLEQKVHALQEKIKQTKAALNRMAGQVVGNFKKQGISALDHVTRALKLEALGASLHDTLKRHSVSLEGSIGAINQTEKRYREGVHHIKNAGRAIRGKSVETEIMYPEKGVFAAMRKPYQSMQKVHERGIADMKRFLTGLDRLEKAGEKARAGKVPSSEKLKQFKQKQEKKDQEAVRNTGQIVGQKGKEQEYGR